MENYNKINMITNFKLFEAVESNVQEYFDAVALHYDENLIDMIKQGEEIASQMTDNGDFKTEKTDNGNLLIRYIEGNNLLIILGAVAISGKMNREDISDMNNWLEQVVSSIEDGITVMSSPNELSEPLIKKIIKKCENKGLKLNIQSQDAVEYDGMTWKNYMISLS